MQRTCVIGFLCLAAVACGDQLDGGFDGDSGLESDPNNAQGTNGDGGVDPNDPPNNPSNPNNPNNPGGAPTCSGLRLRLRDFRDDHPDMEKFTGNGTPGIVSSTLGADKKPVYASTGGTATTAGPTSFAQWYNDTPGVNEAVEVEIALENDGTGHFIYDNSAFFLLDGKGFGNQGREHNFHFTTEVHTKFSYGGGEEFTFKGDDDLWLFINGKLAIDLGGVHGPLAKTIRLDELATELGITKGETYSMDIFHAERHTVESNFRIETTIDCFEPVLL